MVGLMLRCDDVLRARPHLVHGGNHARRLMLVMFLMVVFGTLYEAVMGNCGSGRVLQMLYSGLKVPLLFTATFTLSLPSFVVINTLFGTRRDFPESLRALPATQAGLTIVLAAFAPFTALWYVSFGGYDAAKMFNLFMFAVATVSAQRLLRRFYQPLVERDPRHRTLLRIWLVIFAFVGIQMGWVLRPFVGHPHATTQFVRDEAWGNAYVEIFRTLWRMAGGA